MVLGLVNTIIVTAGLVIPLLLIGKHLATALQAGDSLLGGLEAHYVVVLPYLVVSGLVFSAFFAPYPASELLAVNQIAVNALFIGLTALWMLSVYRIFSSVHDIEQTISVGGD